MPWVYLVVAGVLEIVWAVAMKQSDGFTRLIPSVITLAGMISSVGLLALAMRSLPLGTAYMVWTGIGAVGAFAFGSFCPTGCVFFPALRQADRLTSESLIAVEREFSSAEPID